MNFHPAPFFLSLMHRSQTPQPEALHGSITLLQKFTPHFKILDPCLIVLYITYIYKCQNSNTSYTFLQIFKRGTNVLDVESFNGQAIG